MPPRVGGGFFSRQVEKAGNTLKGHPCSHLTVHTRKEAAKLLGVTTRTLRNMEARGELQPVYVTSRIVGYCDSALRRYLYERTGVIKASG